MPPCIYVNLHNHFLPKPISAFKTIQCDRFREKKERQFVNKFLCIALTINVEQPEKQRNQPKDICNCNWKNKRRQRLNQKKTLKYKPTLLFQLILFLTNFLIWQLKLRNSLITMSHHRFTVKGNEKVMINHFISWMWTSGFRQKPFISPLRNWTAKEIETRPLSVFATLIYDFMKKSHNSAVRFDYWDKANAPKMKTPKVISLW